MIIPWGTDAPIYHRPIATIGMIAVNLALYLLVPSEAYQDFALTIGGGIHPLQWLVSNFLHSGFFEVAGNMLFLWTFGFVVEGKIGGLRFVLIYLLLGTALAGAMQCLVSSEQEVRLLGSSTVVFGLMGICLVWAPRNEVTCILWVRLTPIEFDLSILWFAAMYIAFDVLSGGLSGVLRASLTNLSTKVIVAIELDHTFGALLGMLIGALMLKLRWVDCEDWDLFAVLQRRAGRPKGSGTRTRKAKRPDRRLGKPGREASPRSEGGAKKGRGRGGTTSIEDPSAVVLRAFRGHLEYEEIEAALGVYRKARRAPVPWHPPEPDWRELIEALVRIQRYDDAVAVMRDYVREQSDPSPRVVLKLAQILIQNQGRPQQAIKLLNRFPEGSLPPKLEEIRARLMERAEYLREEGPLELDEDVL